MDPHAGAPIADDLFLIAHHYQDGKPRLPSRLMGMAVSAAVLSDLALLGHVGVRDGALLPLDGATRTDEFGQSVLEQLRSQPSALPVRDWLDYLGPSTVTAVGRRLASAGVVDAQKRWRGWRFVPFDSTAAFFKAGRLATMIDNWKPFSMSEAVLVSLVNAAGLLDVLPCLSPAAARSRVDAVVQSLPTPLNELVAETTATIDMAIITGRT
jgi:Golgi phosphoprotein 3 (GPP34)